MGKRAATQKLFDFSHKDGSAQASLHEEFFALYNIPTIERAVAVTTLDSVCKEHSIDHIDLLKIDVEGCEYEVLQGAARMIGSLSIDIIQFEINALSLISKHSLLDFMTLLTEYRFFRLLYRGLLPLDKRDLQCPSDHQNIIAWSNASSYTYDEKGNQTVCCHTT